MRNPLCVPGCEDSVMGVCEGCGNNLHVSPAFVMCLVCITGESEHNCFEPFTLHAMECPTLKGSVPE